MEPSLASSDLDAAFRSGDENRLVEELRKVASQKAGREDQVALAAGILHKTVSPRVRNAAALALADMRATDAAAVLLEVIRRPDTKGQRGTMLYALEELGADLPLSLLVELMSDDTYEAREQALDFLADGRVSFDQDLVEVRRKLGAGIGTADDERSDAARAALGYLGERE